MFLYEASKKEKKLLELDIKRIIYPVDSKELQERIIIILRQFELTISESKVKRFIDKFVYSTKNDYYDKIDFVIKDIFEERLKIVGMNQVKNLINVLKEVVNGVKYKDDALDTIFRGS